MLSGPPCFPTILLWSGLPHLYRCRLKKKFSRERFWELNGGIIVPCSPASFLRITEVKSFSSPLMSRRDHRGWSRGHCEAVSFMSLAGWVGVCVWDAEGGWCCCMRHIECVCAGRCRTQRLVQSGCCIAVVTAGIMVKRESWDGTGDGAETELITHSSTAVVCVLSAACLAAASFGVCL